MSGYSGDDLVAAVHHLNRVAYYGGIAAKREAVAVLVGVAEGISIATRVLAGDLRQAGYGPEITDGIYKSADAFHSASSQCDEARASLESLLNMSVGDLARSGRQVPHQSELNGGN